MKRFSQIILTLFAFSVITFMACSDSENENNIVDNFDREAMLIHWADEIIIPSFPDIC